MKRVPFLILFLFLFLQKNTAADRLVSYELVKHYSQEDLAERWKSWGIPKLFAPIKSGVNIYEIIYHTAWHDGSRVKASGLLFVPENHADPLPLLSYQHGTDVKKDRVVGRKAEHTIALIFAADGYAVSMPDYLGLGKGEGKHLYQHAETEATACIDMLRTVKVVSEKIGVTLDENKLFLSGYSQGGHATMAMHKMIEEKFSGEFQVRASSPMSGVYDLYKTQDPIMFKQTRHPFFLPYLILSYQEVYKFYDGDVRDIFKPPYDKIMLDLFSGEHGDYEVNKMLPSVPIDMIRDSFVQEYKTNPDFPFTKLLQKNSLYDWKPKAPVQLCYCKDDDIVLAGNSILAYETMKKNGVEHVYLRQAGKKFDHIKCAGVTMLYTKMWLDSFIKGSQKGRKGPVLKRWLLALGKVFADKKI